MRLGGVRGQLVGLVVNGCSPGGTAPLDALLRLCAAVFALESERSGLGSRFR